MQNILVIVFIMAILFSLSYVAAKRIFFKHEKFIIKKAKIDKISLRQIGDVWSPEFLILYYFMYDGEIYSGNDYIRMDDLVPGWELLLFDRHGYPVLATEIGEFIGEEHIEAFVLSQTNTIYVEFNLLKLPHSRIYKESSEPKTLFQNFDIKFPWT